MLLSYRQVCLKLLTVPTNFFSDGEEDYDTVLRQIELTKSVQVPSADIKQLEETLIKEKVCKLFARAVLYHNNDQIEPVGSGNIEVIDDFVRNFLVSMGLQQTANCFQTEWSAIVVAIPFNIISRYELSITGQLSDQYKGTVPDIYVQ